MRIGRMFCLLASALCAALLDMQPLVQAAPLPDLSFQKPFELISAEGERQVGAKWTYGGSTVVNRHFARLTPDRQSKRGNIWSTEKIGRREFSLVFTFRISGQGATWFGDGLALWITKEAHHVNGDNHGFTGEYTGFGLLFDTFVNTEHSGGHKDVTFMENDGTRTLDQLNSAKKEGCDSPGIRYHEKNAGFSASQNISRAKIQFKDNTVRISIDAKNTGDWQSCYSKQLNLPVNWIDDATIGITASTGGLADNHDVIGLSVFDDAVDTAHGEKDELVKNSNTNRDLEEGLMSGDNAAKIRVLKRKYEQLIEDFEHQFTSLQENTANTIKKLREQEQADSKRIEELELWANGKVYERVEGTAAAIRDQVEEKLVETVKLSAEKSSGWKTPFFLLVLVLAGIVLGGYKKYQDLRKSHLL